MIRKFARLFLECCLVGVVAVAVFVGVTLWRLTETPVSLAALTPILAEQLRPEDDSFSISFEKTVLVWDRKDNALAIQAQGAKAIDKDGWTIADSPAVQIDFSVPAARNGVVAPTRLVILKPEVRLARKKDGSIDYGGLVASKPRAEKGTAGDRHPPFSETKVLPVLISEVLREPDMDRPLSFLKEVRIVDARLRIEDQVRGGAWHARNVNLTFGRDVVGLRAGLAMDIDVGGQIAKVRAAGLYSKVDDELSASLTFLDIDPSVVGASVPGLEALDHIRVPIRGDINLVMSGDGKLKAFKVNAAGRGGTIRLPDDTRREVAVQRFETTATLSPDLRRIDLQEIEIEFVDGPTLEVGGSVDIATIARRTNLTATILNVDMSKLGNFWPHGMAEGAREWITANVTEGKIPEIQAALSMRYLDGVQRDESGIVVGRGATGWDVVYARGAMLYSGLEVTFLEGLPPVRGVAGHSTFDQNAFDLKIRSGTLEGLAVGPGAMRIEGLQDAVQWATVTVDLKGKLSEALRIIDYPRLGYASLMGIKPADIGGDTGATMRVRLPLLKDLDIDRVELEVSADIASLRWPNALDDREFTSPRMHLDLDGTRMVLTGAGKLAKVDIELTWRENFTDDDAYRRRLEAGGRIDLADLASLGFGTSPYITGKAPVQVTYSELLNGTGTVALKADLTPALIIVEELSYSKPSGAPAKASFVLDLKDGKVAAMRDLDLIAPGMTLAGAAEFNPGTGKIRGADITRFAFGRNDIKGKLRIDDNGLYRLVVAGPSLDISGFISPPERKTKADDTKESGAFKLPPLQAEARIERLYTYKKRYLTEARLDVHYDGTIWRGIEFSGDMAPTRGKSARFEMSLLPKGGARTLDIQSNDGGAVFRTLGITTDIYGGKLVGSGTIDDSMPKRPLSATLKMNGFELKNAPAMARLLTLASLGGIAAALNGPGIDFSRLKVPFVMTEDSIVIPDATAIGDDLGFTLKGALNRKADTVNFAGTIVPSYTLNSLVGNIPVLGDVLVGSKSSGIFAASYTMKGSLDEPDISVNPLSILAPGILRGLLGGQVDLGGQVKMPGTETGTGSGGTGGGGDGETAQKPPRPNDPSIRPGGRGRMGQ